MPEDGLCGIGIIDTVSVWREAYDGTYLCQSSADSLACLTLDGSLVALPYFSCSAMLRAVLSYFRMAYNSQSRLKRANSGPGTSRSGEVIIR